MRLSVWSPSPCGRSSTKSARRAGSNVMLGPGPLLSSRSTQIKPTLGVTAMKKLLIGSTVFLLALGAGTAPAFATDELPEPSGEEYAVTLVVPSAPGGCATSPADITGIGDLYYDYAGTPELVATWSVVEDAKGFLITATLVNKYYSLNNPLAPGRSTSATFSIPRCVNPGFLEPAPVEPEPVVPAPAEPVADPVVTVPEPVVAAPVVPAAPVVAAPTGPAVPVGPVVAAPVPAAPAVVVPAPLAVTGEASVVPEIVVAAAAPEELANTGAREDLLFLTGGVALALVLAGGGVVFAARKR